VRDPRRFTRRSALTGLSASAAALFAACKNPPVKIDPVTVRARPVVPVKILDPLLDDVRKRTFNFF